MARRRHVLLVDLSLVRGLWCVMACCLVTLAVNPAAAQRIANQFDQQAADATRSPTPGLEQQRSVDTSIARPYIPKETTRPAAWPSSTKSQGSVVSSIRTNPNSPLVPIDGPSPVGSETIQALAAVPLGSPSGDATVQSGFSEQGGSSEQSGVVQTQYVEPATTFSPTVSQFGAASGQPEVLGADPRLEQPRMADGFSQAGATPAGEPPAELPVDPLLSQAQSLQTAMVVARVGPEVVLESDLITPAVAAWLEKVTPGLPPEQVRELKMQVYEHLLTQYVESMIVYVDACRTIPAEALPEIEAKVNQAFDAEQLPRLMQEAGVANSLEYEQLLRSRGQSLDRLKKAFFERAIAQQWLAQALEAGAGGEIPHAELIAYYQEHLSDYEYSAKAKFEELCVRFGSNRTREEAWGVLAGLGNRVLTGETFAEVAKQGSEGPTASQGGAYDWTSQGSLRSQVIDEAIFSLPIGKLSTILEDESGLHIVRVVERTDAGRTSFLEAQVGIRDALRAERHEKAVDEYLSKVRERTPVWTIFDDEEDRQQDVTMVRGTAAGR